MTRMRIVSRQIREDLLLFQKRVARAGAREKTQKDITHRTYITYIRPRYHRTITASVISTRTYTRLIRSAHKDLLFEESSPSF